MVTTCRTSSSHFYKDDHERQNIPMWYFRSLVELPDASYPRHFGTKLDKHYLSKYHESFSKRMTSFSCFQCAKQLWNVHVHAGVPGEDDWHWFNIFNTWDADMRCDDVRSKEPKEGCENRSCPTAEVGWIMKKPRSLVSDPAIVRPKSPPNKNVSNKASNKRETLRKRLSKTPWKIPRGFFAELLGGRYVDVESAEVLIHGMYATQRHHSKSTHWVHPPWSPVFSLLRKDAELMPQLCWVELYSWNQWHYGKLWDGASIVTQ